MSITSRLQWFDFYSKYTREWYGPKTKKGLYKRKFTVLITTGAHAEARFAVLPAGEHEYYLLSTDAAGFMTSVGQWSGKEDDPDTMLRIMPLYKSDSPGKNQYINQQRFSLKTRASGKTRRFSSRMKNTV